jgi:hypothetical protein
MAHYRVTLCSNQRDPIQKPWRAKTRLAALELIAAEVVPEMIGLERAGGFFNGEVIQVRIEQVQE